MPRRVRPKFPKEWHVPNDPKLWMTWANTDEKLRKEEVYWVSTASKNGRPHAAPVWGIWKGGKFYFETDPESTKGRNLRANPRIVFHLQDGLDTVIVEGNVSLEKDPKELDYLMKAYIRKYDYKPDWSNSDAQVVFKVVPSIAHAWRAPRMHRNLVNFVFQPESGSGGA
jgi:nitroimidazol reductase NimA-like FMN-containing flavoprotein (pyridoxamine 5'-phosphate oxidase superfamily)